MGAPGVEDFLCPAMLSIEKRQFLKIAIWEISIFFQKEKNRADKR